MIWFSISDRSGRAPDLQTRMQTMYKYEEPVDARYHSLIEMLQWRAKAEPDFVLFRFLSYETGEPVLEDHTVGEVYEKSLSLAYTLKKNGLKKGDRAVILSMQDFGTVCAVYGCMMAGVTFTLLPPPLDDGKVDRLISVLKSCRPKALISNYALEKSSGVNIVPRLLKEAFRYVVALKRIYTDKLIPYHKADIIEPAADDDLVYLQYTSGSTSAPKGVRILQKALMKNMEGCQNVYDFNNVTLATWVPFFHNLGLTITIFMPLCTRHSTGYFLQTLEFLSHPKLWIRMISDYHLTLTLAPNSAYDACTRIFTREEAAQYDLSQVTHFMNGSEFISPVTIDAFCDLFHVDKNAFACGYGLAESVCLASVAGQDYREVSLDPEAYQENRLVLSDAPDAKRMIGLGHPIKDLTVLACNPRTLRAYRELHIGELFVSGAGVADGYWEDPKESRKFHYHIQGHEGEFYKTGDLGFIKDGYIYLTGRIKEIIVVNGHNVYPSDLTLLVQEQIPELALAAVGFFGCNIGEREQAVACLEARPGINFAAYASKISRLVSEYCGFPLYDIIFVPLDTIPRTDNRKLQMIKTKRLYLEGKLPILYSSRKQRTGKTGAAGQNSASASGKSRNAAESKTGSREDNDNRPLPPQKTSGLNETPAMGEKATSGRTAVADETAAQEEISAQEEASAAEENSAQKRTATAPKLSEMTDDLSRQVKAVYDRILNIDQYSLNESFLELGGDSLKGYELLQNMEEKFHVKLDLRELLQDSSVNGVTRYLRRVLAGRKASGRKIKLADECVLDESIRPREEYDLEPADCRHLFLTGSTGFLGAHLIRSLIRQYPHGGLKIFCLVRAETPEKGLRRIIRNMEHYHIWKDAYRKYIIAVPGDLTQPLLGLDVESFLDLADDIDAVYHNGALLNFVYPYEFLKSTNVGGTVETLRLACAGKPKYYHYISSYSVYDTPDHAGKRVYENDELKKSKGFSLAYSETKWVSEKIVHIAEERGLRAAIYRPGDIVGSRRGIWDVDDMISRMIVGTIQMKCVPYTGYEMQLTPVDYVADAVACISRKPEAVGQAFNVINPKPTSVKDLVPMIWRCGYQVRYVPFAVWKRKLKTADPDKNALAILSCLFDVGTDSNPGVMRHFMGKNPKYDTSKTALLLNRTGIRCPEIDRKMVAAYLAYFRKLGYI